MEGKHQRCGTRRIPKTTISDIRAESGSAGLSRNELAKREKLLFRVAQLKVKAVQGADLVEMPVSLGTKILRVKEIVERSSGIPVEEQVMSYENFELADDFQIRNLYVGGTHLGELPAGQNIEFTLVRRSLGFFCKAVGKRSIEVVSDSTSARSNEEDSESGVSPTPTTSDDCVDEVESDSASAKSHEDATEIPNQSLQCVKSQRQESHGLALSLLDGGVAWADIESDDEDIPMLGRIMRKPLFQSKPHTPSIKSRECTASQSELPELEESHYLAGFRTHDGLDDFRSPLDGDSTKTGGTARIPLNASAPPFVAQTNASQPQPVVGVPLAVVQMIGVPVDVQQTLYPDRNVTWGTCPASIQQPDSAAISYAVPPLYTSPRVPAPAGHITNTRTWLESERVGRDDFSDSDWEPPEEETPGSVAALLRRPLPKVPRKKIPSSNGSWTSTAKEVRRLNALDLTSSVRHRR